MSVCSLLYKRTRRQSRVRYKLQRYNYKNRCRLSVFKSNSHLYAQIIDDSQHKTLVYVSTLNKELRETIAKPDKVKVKNFNNQIYAKKLGEILASRAKAAGIAEVVFDRGRYLYHGVVKALGDSVRENGLKF